MIGARSGSDRRSSRGRLGRPVSIFIAAVAAVALVYLLGTRWAFLHSAAEITGEVTRVEARNARCGTGRKRRSRYPCTKFYAKVEYRAPRSGWSSA